MKDIQTKVDFTTTLSADDFNQVAVELENAIKKTGQTLSGANLNQIGEAMARYSSNGGSWYKDNGVADSYILASIDPGGAFDFLHPSAYFEGMLIGCIAKTSSTAAGSVINVNGIGQVDLKDASGGALKIGSITVNAPFFARYFLANNEFRIVFGATSLLDAPGIIVITSPNSAARFIKSCAVCN